MTIRRSAFVTQLLFSSAFWLTSAAFLLVPPDKPWVVSYMGTDLYIVQAGRSGLELDWTSGGVKALITGPDLRGWYTRRLSQPRVQTGVLSGQLDDNSALGDLDTFYRWIMEATVTTGTPATPAHPKDWSLSVGGLDILVTHLGNGLIGDGRLYFGAILAFDLLITFIPAVWCGRILWLRHHRRSRMRRRCCARCGYDLRATIERCPECGSILETVNVGN